MALIRPKDPMRISTGVAGLDEILGGGFPVGRTYVLRGRSGSGKTTLGLQFALDGARKGERVLYVMLTETRPELMEVAASHGWSLDGIVVHEVVDQPDALMEDAGSTLFRPSDMELGATVQEILALTRKHRPSRVVIDPLSELRLMAGDPLRFRRQFLAFKQVVAEVGATALLVEEVPTPTQTNERLENVAHGVLCIEQDSPDYGPDRRHIRVLKVRGMSYMGGYHDLDIVTGGMVVHPRTAELDEPAPVSREPVSTEIDNLDELLGGGIDRGTNVLVAGAAGTGKSSLLIHLVDMLSRRGMRSRVLLFEEMPWLFQRRAAGLGMPLEAHVENGTLAVEKLNGDVSPGRLFQSLRDDVRLGGIQAVVLDSLTGLRRSMYSARSLEIRLRLMLSWLARRGIITFMTLPCQTSSMALHREDLTYLADTVILLHHMELDERLGRAISVMKRRGGAHDTTIRSLDLTSAGLEIGSTALSAEIRRPILHYPLMASPIPPDTRPGNGGPLQQSDRRDERQR